MPNNIDIATPPDNLEKLLELAMPELEAFDSTSSVRRLVTRARVLELSDVLLTSWATLSQWIDEELSPARAEQRKVALARLDTRAWVYYGTDLAAEEIRSNKARKARRQLAKAVAEHDRYLFKWAMPLFADDPEDAETLRDISRGTGLRDDAEDVLRLVALYRERWPEIKDLQNAVTEARLEQAVADATKQLDYLRNGLSNPARKLADAAYSLWYADYNDLMQLGRYLTWRDDDSHLRFPGVRELPTNSKGSDDEVVDEVVEQEQPAQEQDLDANA